MLSQNKKQKKGSILKVLLRELIKVIDEIEYYSYFEDHSSQIKLSRLFIERDFLFEKLINQIDGENEK